ncbi:hypothetical protein KP509_39G037600 [Ceratopteris richardii]|nr:hypothetical protein KP509_39G037600 [Ceratopteris richardii]
MSSSVSLAVPYIAYSSEGGGIFSMLFSAIKDSCDLETRPGKTIVMGSCLRGTFDLQSPIMSDGVEVVDTVGDVKDFILKQKESRQDHETDIIFACPMSNDELEKGESEADLLASVFSSLHGSGTSAAFLYASDPFHGTQSHGRLLASNSTSTCDEICETVAGTYEGVIVAITLLIILISGLCCMMGIDTPSRFERASDQ